jgi:hypothetical protein
LLRTTCNSKYVIQKILSNIKKEKSLGNQHECIRSEILKALAMNSSVFRDIISFLVGSTALVGPGLLTSGRTPWTSDQPVALRYNIV